MALCEIALALGLTLSGACTDPAQPPALPAGDASAWSYKEPPPPPPPPPPAPQPERIIERVEVIREVPVPAAPAPAPEPDPEPVPLADPMMVMWAQYAAAANAWRESNAGAMATVPGPVSPRAVNRPEAPAPPLPSVPVSHNPMAMPASPAMSTYKWTRKDSTGPVNNERIVAADRYISGVLETGINSQLTDGEVIIVITQHVYGAHSRLILIPRGSRMICSYKGPADMGSSRLQLRCKRLLLAESRAELRIRAKAGDQQGRAGITGEVDNRFVERYGTAFVLAGISATVRLGAAATQTGTTPSGASYALQQGAQELGQQLGEITAAALEKSLDLKPIITIPQGTRVSLLGVDDWYLAPPNAPDVPDETMTAEADPATPSPPNTSQQKEEADDE
ncbi:TraB/TrbI/VirB10 family type IV secretion system protein [Insolitispirillum peregrinum]|uniref:TrbI/VirB10 family protein n=1 Tax=Insolitispirillum peregrinum TaxID=80876 RepID=UPI003612521F